ncbi:hypothetical protein F2P44_31640 [Massilia sp. CCM 8695]|uniref:Uncharacterized protein n=1 Tax=Massilia frigida TaxID=2609281 RepID=A0ABX0NF71_9BURK|nr:hypothetical protein [Massilia frigida]NHZ83787.1 hypothetical protein [Massilia frigida]
MRFKSPIAMFLLGINFAVASVAVADSTNVQSKPRALEPVTKIAHFTGDNTLTMCAMKAPSSCEQISMPVSVGDVKQIVYGHYNFQLPGSWLAFDAEKVSLCLYKKGSVIANCEEIGPVNYKGVTVTYETVDGVPGLIFKHKQLPKEDSRGIIKEFEEKVFAAAKKLAKKNEPSASKDTALCKGESCTPTTTIEPDMVVEITAPFPDNFFAGTVEMVTLSWGDGDGPPEVPDPMPDGVAPSDYLKARDPAGMVACTASYYKVYVTMATGCVTSNMGPTGMRICLERSLSAYYNNLKTECYDKYF